MASINTELFIKEISMRPAIWKSKHPKHRHKNYVGQLWIDLQGLFPEFNVVELKKKWKNLKDTFRKELKKNPQANVDPDCPFPSTWIHFELMEFLRNELSVPNDAPEDEDNNNDGQSSDNDNETQEIKCYYSPLPSPSPDPETCTSSCNHKTKHSLEEAEQFDIERKRLKILESELTRQNNEKHSDNYHFLMSILPEMDKLHPIQRFRLRNNINQALMEEMTLAMYGDPLAVADSSIVGHTEDSKHTVLASIVRHTEENKH